MILSDEGAQFIAQFEGFSSVPYVDPGTGGEPITTGYGTTVYSSGKKVTMQDSPITKEDALKELISHVSSKVADWIDKNIPNQKQYQFDALCSLAYNVGTGNLLDSTIRRVILGNKPDMTITAAFLMWNRANSKVMPGLTRRRTAEAKLYCTGQY